MRDNVCVGEFGRADGLDVQDVEAQQQVRDSVT
jgi:hypothetical protein